MTFIKNWEDFERSAEKLYLANPMKVTISAHGARKEQIINKISSAPKLPVWSQVRYTMKYRHSQGALILKFTDDAVVGTQPAVFYNSISVNLRFLCTYSVCSTRQRWPKTCAKLTASWQIWPGTWSQTTNSNWKIHNWLQTINWNTCDGIVLFHKTESSGWLTMTAWGRHLAVGLKRWDARTENWEGEAETMGGVQRLSSWVGLCRQLWTWKVMAEWPSRDGGTSKIWRRENRAAGVEAAEALQKCHRSLAGGRRWLFTVQ